MKNEANDSRIETFQNALMIAEGFEVADFENEREYLDAATMQSCDMDDMEKAHGGCDENETTEFGTIYTWLNRQSGKGKTRGSIRAMEIRGAVVMSFSGE